MMSPFGQAWGKSRAGAALSAEALLSTPHEAQRQLVTGTMAAIARHPLEVLTCCHSIPCKRPVIRAYGSSETA
jgi:hypothetical protein